MCAWSVAQQILSAEREAEQYFQAMTQYGQCNWVIAYKDDSSSPSHESSDRVYDRHWEKWECDLTDDLPVAANTVIGTCVKVNQYPTAVHMLSSSY